MRIGTSWLVLTLLFLALSPFCFAQSWQAVNPPLTLFTGSIDRTLYDASGKLYAVGRFKNSTDHYFVAHWNGTNWIELGSGASALKANGAAITLASQGDTLYAAGAFTNSSGKYYVAKWNGTAWMELGTGTSALRANGIIYSIVTDKAGNVYAAGGFTNSAGQHYVAKWDGTSWSELGAGLNTLNANENIYAVAADRTGNVYAAGYFKNASDKFYVARWNGTSWSDLSTGATLFHTTGYFGCLATDSTGSLYAGGSFRNSQNNYFLAKWDGTTWSEMGSGANSLQANNAIGSIAINTKNEVFVAGIFTNPNGFYYVAKWDGTTWSEINSPQSALVAFDRINTIAITGEENVVAAGEFKNKNGQSYVSQWNGNSWSELGWKGDPFHSNSSRISQIVGDSVGNVYVSGEFEDAGGRFYIQHWNGNTWKQLQPPYGSAISLYLKGPEPLAVDKKGVLYAPGHFRNNGLLYNCILKWDGSQWSILESIPNELQSINQSSGVYGIWDIKMDAHDNMYVMAGSLKKWDGKTWSTLPNSNIGIDKFCVASDGTIYAYGGFTNNIGRSVIVRYHPTNQPNWVEVKNGSSELSVPGFNVFMDLATDSKNNLYVNGSFTNAAGNRYVAKWNGTFWQELGATSNLGELLLIDQADNLFVNKYQHASWGEPALKWNGTSWIGFGLPSVEEGSRMRGSVLGMDRVGNLYSDKYSWPAIGTHVIKYGATVTVQPKLLSFSPATGSLGTTVTITGKNLKGTGAVRFGGTPASSFAVKNDSTLTAVVADGSTGSIVVETTGGVDSLQTFVFTCDSVIGPVPFLRLEQDTWLVSSRANHYQWYYNNQPLAGETNRNLRIRGTGFYRVESSTNKVCWVPSLDYPLFLNSNPLPDSLKMMVYPNPSSGQFTVYVKLPQTTTVKTHVQVLDINGVQVLQTARLVFYGNEIRIPITLTTKGTYFVKVFVNNDTVQQSIIIL